MAVSPTATAGRAPVRKQVREAERRKVCARVRNRRAVDRRADNRRFAVVYDVDGPRVRLGIVWFSLLVASLIAGAYAVTVLYALVAGAAAVQTARAGRRRRLRPHRQAAGLAAIAIVAGAALGSAGVGVALLGLAAAAVVLANQQRRPGRAGPMVDAGITVQCALFAGLAGASAVLTMNRSLSAAVTLVLLVSAYEVGDYLVGSGASNPYEGPAAGIAALLVVSFAVALARAAPLDDPGGWVHVVAAAVACPLGPLVASAVLPSAAAPAPALRRIDTLVVLGPVWVVLLQV
ncbi:hypothetical protein BH24ACT3_BH24ACT3_10340 [soil metagenome]